MARWGRGGREAMPPDRVAGRTLAPSARRLRSAPLSDLRLWAGVVLLVASMAVGARVLSAGDDTVTVWQAGRDLSAGATAADLVPVTVSRAVAGDRYLGPDADLAGELRWPVAAGELLPRTALTALSSAPTRQVTVPVDPMHAPADLQRGAVVDMWSTPRDAGAGAPTSGADPVLVLPALSVLAVAGADTGISGELGVVLEVPADSVAAVVAAGRGGVTDLVAVPATSQAVRS